MEYLDITKQTSYESVKDEFYTLVENEFEDTLWRSYHSWNDQLNFSSPLKNIWKPSNAYSSKVFDNLQKSFIGEAASKVSCDSYFENFNSLLGQDDSLANYSDDMTSKRSAEIEVKKSWEEKSVKQTFQKPSDVYTGRIDVVNKSILRMIKSYYLQQLYKLYPSYKTKRLCRVNKSQLLGDINSVLISSSSTSQNLSKLGEVIFWALRPSDAHFISKDIEFLEEVKMYFDCIAKYSHKRLMKVYSGTFGHTLFESIYSEDMTFEHLLNSHKLSNKNKNAYEEGFKRFLKGFGISERSTTI